MFYFEQHMSLVSIKIVGTDYRFSHKTRIINMPMRFRIFSIKTTFTKQQENLECQILTKVSPFIRKSMLKLSILIFCNYDVRNYLVYISEKKNLGKIMIRDRTKIMNI